MLLSGNAFKKNWHHPKREFDFYDMKSLLYNFLNELEISKFDLVRTTNEWFHPGISADFISNGKKSLVLVNYTLPSRINLKLNNQL